MSELPSALGRALQRADAALAKALRSKPYTWGGEPSAQELKRIRMWETAAREKAHVDALVENALRTTVLRHGTIYEYGLLHEALTHECEVCD